MDCRSAAAILSKLFYEGFKFLDAAIQAVFAVILVAGGSDRDVFRAPVLGQAFGPGWPDGHNDFCYGPSQGEWDGINP